MARVGCEGARVGGVGDHNAKSAPPCATYSPKPAENRHSFRWRTSIGAPPDAGPVPLADLIAAIVERAQRLRAPSARDPEAFHLDKGELVGALVALERRVRGVGR